MPEVELSGVTEFTHVEAPEGMPEGSRNWDLYRYACSLQARGVSDEDMVDECLKVASTMDPPLAAWEVLSVVRSAQTKQKGGHGTLGRRRQAQRTMPEILHVPLRHGHPERLEDWSGVRPIDMARAWVKSLFEPTETVCLVVDPSAGYRKGRGGELHAYAGQLADPGDPLLARVLGSVGPSGLYGVVNPLDGSGRRKGETVTAFRNLLVECDELPSDAQLERICALLMNWDGSGLPRTVALTWSGGKSWHAIVRVRARDAGKYAAFKDWVYESCRENGFPVDAHCGNPSRLTRVAGAMRGGELQRMAYCRRPGRAWDGTPAEWAERGDI